MSNNKIIRASAGTGKTYQLTNRYIRLLLDGAKPQEILAVTFTKKAAGEIFDRVLKKLADAANAPEECRKLSYALYGSETQLTQETARRTLARFVQNMHRQRISTIDSYFGQAAKTFSPELGFPFEWTIVDDTAAARNRERAILRMFEKGNAADIRDLIYDFSKGEVNRTLTAEIDDMLKNYEFLLRESERDVWFKVPLPDETPRTPQQQEQILDELRNGLDETFQNHADKKGESRTTENLMSTGSKLIDAYRRNDPETLCGNKLFSTVVFDSGNTYSRSVELSPGWIDTIKTISADAKTVLFKVLKKETESTYTLINEISKRQEEIKDASGEYGFDDVTFRLASRGESLQDEYFNYRLDTRTRHLLLDEFQDTSFFQWKILKPLADALVCGEADQSSFFCVGDTKQSIYGWRGGLPEIFDHVEDVYCNQKNAADPEPLDTNWRSAPKIIEVVNAFFKDLAKHELLGMTPEDKTEAEIRRAKELHKAAEKWDKCFNTHQCAPDNLSLTGFVSLEEPPRFDTRPQEEWEEIFHESFENKYRQGETLKLAYAAHRIAQIHREKPNASIGVLFRTNKKIDDMTARLKKLGITEVSQEGGAPLTTAGSVQAVLALLRLAEHPGDTAAFLRAASLKEWSRLFPESCRPDQTRLAEKGYPEEAAGALSLGLRNRIMTIGLGAFVREAADLILPGCSGREAEKLNALVLSAFRFESGPARRLDLFIRQTETTAVSLPGDSVIHLTTIHKSKGLEYDIVVLCELDDTVVSDSHLPKVMDHRPQPTEAPDLIFRKRSTGCFYFFNELFKETYAQKWEAEANGSFNLLYVAMTRAKRELVMIASPRSLVNARAKTKKEAPLKTRSFENLLRLRLGTNEEEPETSAAAVIERRVDYQIGDPDWYGKDPGFSGPGAAAALPIVWVPRTDLGNSAAGQHAARREKAPSQKDFKRSWQPSEARERGLVLHACFEQIEWLGREPLSDERFEEIKNRVRAQLFKCARLPREKEAQFGVYTEGFRRLCGDERVRHLLSPEYYADTYKELGRSRLTPRVYREHPYIIHLSNGRKKGIIDRLVVLWDGKTPVAADIIDFKTDIEVHQPETDTGEYVRKAGYDHQLGDYRQNVMRQYGLGADRTAARLFFFSCDAGNAYVLPPFEVPR